MKKFLKVLRNIFVGMIAITAILLIGATIYNQLMIKKDDVYWKNPPGEMVEVDGHKMHIYTEGEGEHTILLMSGWSVSSPSPYLNLLPLCKDLAKNNKVVIIERFGYGISDVVGGERSFDKLVDQDREALEKLGIKGPYVLCPHSLSGLESLIWAQNYPDEVEAIVGMDMSDTSIKGDNEMSIPMLRLIGAIRATGLYRLLPFPDDATEEMKMEHAIQCKTLSNKTIINELSHIDAACDMINEKPLPTVPTLQFVAMQKRTAEEVEAWKATHQELVSASSNGKLVELDCTHYVYRFEKDRIVQEINAFLETL
ncbi:MAG: alpha/beta hydrolase [Eubacterium sp.]|nr:alpha/beta hydrolase [Eubacterium sp.]